MTAQSEPINIPIDQKIEVVKTLTAYPLILEELLIHKKMISVLEHWISVQEQQLLISNDIISEERKIKDLLMKQNQILSAQLKKQNLKFKLLGVGGAAIIVGALLLK